MDPDSSCRIVVLSDLHAYENIGSRSKAPSALHMAGGEGEVARLFDGVKAALDEAGVTSVDALVCAGDITDRAEAGALIQVWERLDGLAKELDARLLATAGNHDYASHQGGPVDPKEGLMDLAPLFPAGDADAHRDYFAYAVAAADLNDTRFVLFNSCALHGFFKEDIPEYEHGRVTKSGIKRISEAMAKAPRQTLNVLITHHHPVQLPYFDTDERSQIIDGGLLIKLLEDDGEWIVIHGHKHRPWIQYAQGGGASPILFSAGSFAADLGGDNFGGSLRNQFYLIELLSPTESAELGIGLAGTIRAWSRIPYGEVAWAPAGPTDGMAAESGFGWRIHPRLVADRMEAWLMAQGGTISQEEIYAWEPRLRYLTPDDFKRMVRLLEGRGRYKFKQDNCGRVTGIEFAANGAS